MIPTLWVALGGAIGSVGRYWTGIAAARLIGGSFPWGTIMINILGSFVIGLAAAIPDGPSPFSGNLRAFVMVGLCGGYTTFSAFSLQLLAQLRAGDWPAAAANAGMSVVLCVLSVAAGYAVGGRMSGN